MVYNYKVNAGTAADILCYDTFRNATDCYKQINTNRLILNLRII